MSYSRKSPEEIRKMIAENDINLIDVRSAPERAEGYIKDSLCIDVRDSDFEKKLNEFDKNKILVLYCLGGNRSAVAAARADSLGFQKVYLIEGGITAWKKYKLPTEK